MGEKMLYVLLEGHDYSYEIGELVKSYRLFNRISFIKDKQEIGDGDYYFLINRIREEEDRYIIRSTLKRKEEVIGVKEIYFYKNNGLDLLQTRKQLKRMIKISIYDLFTEVFEIKLPWGILTGIRPTKIVHEYLDEKLAVDEIKDKLRSEYRLNEEKIQLLVSIANRERQFLKNCEKGICLYISIPFCPSRCIYCSFPANPIKEGSDIIDIYLKALFKEIEGVAEIINCLGLKVETIYIGGGTPTTLSSRQMDELINKIFKEFNINELLEFTVEAGRPDTIDKEKLLILKKNKVDRISINPQSMNDKTLRLIGRNHSVKDIINAYYLAKDVGFKTINMDIIVGLPEEGIEEINNTLREIDILDPENLTVHTLAIKRSSILRNDEGSYLLSSEKTAIDMIEATKNFAKKKNLFSYYMYRQKYMIGNLENIGYAKEGHECIYNIQIMEERQSIIALGAGAISKIVYPEENRLERVPNVKSIKDYVEKIDSMIDRKRIELMK